MQSNTIPRILWCALLGSTVGASLACMGISSNDPAPATNESSVQVPESDPAQQVEVPTIANYDYIACWFSESWGHYIPGGESPEETVQGPMGPLGQFQHGTGGMFFDGALSACLANGMQFMVEERLLGSIHKWDESFWMTALTVWSGFPVKNSTNKRDNFIHVNPEFAVWLQGMVPANDGSRMWHNQTLQEIYDAGFSRYVRLMTEARMSIANTRNIEEHVRTLMLEGTLSRTMLMPLSDFGDVGVLEQAPYEWVLSHDNLSPWQAVSFWLRRHKDGSIDEVWGIFLLILDRFDPTWRVHLQQQYPDARVYWASEPVEPLDLASLTVVETDIGAASILYIDGIVRPNRHPAAVLTAGSHDVLIQTHFDQVCSQLTMNLAPQKSIVYEVEIWDHGTTVPCPSIGTAN